MDLEYIILIPVAAFGVYLTGRIFGLGFKASLTSLPSRERGSKQSVIDANQINQGD